MFDCTSLAVYLDIIVLIIPLKSALKERGIDKLLDDAREDNKENDARLSAPKSKSTLCRTISGASFETNKRYKNRVDV